MIFVIDDDEVMAECIARATKEKEVRIFSNAIEAMNAVAAGEMPEIIFMEIIINGPDGFSFLNEMVSYTDTARIPVVVVSMLDFRRVNLKMYGVVEVLRKDTMLPQDIRRCVEMYVRNNG